MIAKHLNMNDYPAGPHRWSEPLAVERIAAMEQLIRDLEARLKDALAEHEKEMGVVCADLLRAQADNDQLTRDLTAILADNLDHQALLLDAEGKIERLMQENEALREWQVKANAELAKVKADVQEHIALCLAANNLIDATRAELSDAISDYNRCVDDVHEARQQREEALAERDALKQSINRFHHIMHKAGLHPGRTDDDLLEILERHLAARKEEGK
jgi:chromosome segregation ATPase